MKVKMPAENNTDIPEELRCYNLTDELNIQRNILYKEVMKQQDENLQEDNIAKSTKPLPIRKRRIYKPNSKRVGFTKIRMEDCLRCDACSCIYIDPQDYYKHMRNFHQKYNTIIPRTRRKSDFKMALPVSLLKKTLPISIPQVPENKVKETIKTRWSKLSERLSASYTNGIVGTPNIKTEPEDDNLMSYLLAQVEVRIKTEPV